MAPSRCAYPRCPSRGPNPRPGGITAVAGEVWLCAACGGLQLACQSAKCQRAGTLNRPFARFCRRCQEDLVPDPPGRGAAVNWERARRAGWGRPLLQASEPEVVADLGARLGYERPTTRVGLGIAQGVLALHEVHPRGGALALLRPLAQGAADPVVWEQSESPTSGGVEVPFDPLLLPGGRFLLFARPGRVTVLDLWGCPGLSAYEAVPPRIAELADWPLAAPPVPLGRHAFGLLSRGGSGTYRWAVWDLSRPDQVGADLAAAPSATTDLPLEGSPCQLELVDDRVLTLATYQGHWVWRKADAAAARAQELRRTWPRPGAPPDRTIELDPHVDDRRAFRWAFREPRHGFLVHRPGEVPRFEWVYRVRSGHEAAEWGERYEVDFTTLEVNLPAPIAGRAADAAPIGSVQQEYRGESFAAEMLFRRGSDLLREDLDRVVHACHQHLPKSLSGLQLFDPLLVVIGRGEDRRRYLQVDSLPHPTSQYHVNDLEEIASDPVIWGRWLFTVEEDGRTGLVVRRRELIPAPRA